MIEYYKNFSLEPLFYVNENGLVCQEEWKDIPDYVGYFQASDLGRIKSLRRKVFNGRGFYFSKEKIRKQSFSKKKYLRTTITINQKTRSRATHVLVAITFLNHIPNLGKKSVVDHIKNEERTNNQLSNLQIITSRHNTSKDRVNNSSKYTGVSWSKEKRKFVSAIKINKKQNQLGYFNNEYDAHLAYQKALSDYENFGILPFKEKLVFSSNYKGVTWYKSLNKWRCAIVFNKKMNHIGYFTEEIDAHKAYLNAEEQIKQGVFLK